VRAGVNYSWEPAATVPAGNVAVDTAADEESTELYDLGEALQGGEGPLVHRHLRLQPATGRPLCSSSELRGRGGPEESSQ